MLIKMRNFGYYRKSIETLGGSRIYSNLYQIASVPHVERMARFAGHGMRSVELDKTISTTLSGRFRKVARVSRPRTF